MGWWWWWGGGWFATTPSPTRPMRLAIVHAYAAVRQLGNHPRDHLWAGRSSPGLVALRTPVSRAGCGLQSSCVCARCGGSDGMVSGVETVQLERDPSGKMREIRNSETTWPASLVLLALGFKVRRCLPTHALARTTLRPVCVFVWGGR